MLTHARATFPSLPLYGAMGWLHLSGFGGELVPSAVGKKYLV